MDTKICTRCLEEKPLKSFGKRKFGEKTYPTTRCHTCRGIVERERGWRKAETLADEKERRNTRRRARRASGLEDGYFIFRDCRESDNKKQRPNDLDRPFIDDLITKPCFYCEGTDIRMTLDRIDNAGGHTKDNVIQACYRCNHTRGDMPFEAWKFLAEGMKAARLAGAFGEWSSKSFSRK